MWGQRRFAVVLTGRMYVWEDDSHCATVENSLHQAIAALERYTDKWRDTPKKSGTT